MQYFLGVDVGTGSARAGIFDASGVLLAAASREITRFQPQPDFAQQSSAEIWQAICHCVAEALATAKLSGDAIAGIGFDATCSMVVEDADGNPVSISPDGAAEQDIIMWLDHRATGDAASINATGAEPLKYVGGIISPEMQMPKLRWLKRELPDAWARAARFWDLPDWLAYRATGADVRSMCSTVCKWTYLGHKGTHGEGWDTDFFAEIGVDDLADDTCAAVGRRIVSAGSVVGKLNAKAAKELGLNEGTPVSSALIDAYAGALGTLGVMPEQGAVETRMAVIAGTSTCHVAISRDPVFVPGVWGPYYSVLMPEWWALEGGQSAAGALIDAVIARHGASAELDQRAQAEGQSIYAVLEAVLSGMAQETALLTAHRHVQPDFHGNRAPLADPSRKGAISGLTLAVGLDDLALDYLATLQALSYGTRHILEEMRAQGVPVSIMVVSGGLAKNHLFLRELSDATGCKVLVPEQAEPVLLGSAMLGAVAAEAYADLAAAMAHMSGDGMVISPRTGAIQDFHEQKYKVFREMQNDFAKYQHMMEP